MSAVICGFAWLTRGEPCTEGGTSNAHECCSKNEHEEYTNTRHFCGCGEKLDCRRGEETLTIGVDFAHLESSDEGVPF